MSLYECHEFGPEAITPEAIAYIEQIGGRVEEGEHWRLFFPKPCMAITGKLGGVYFAGLENFGSKPSLVGRFTSDWYSTMGIAMTDQQWAEYEPLHFEYGSHTKEERMEWLRRHCRFTAKFKESHPEFS